MNMKLQIIASELANGCAKDDEDKRRADFFVSPLMFLLFLKRFGIIESTVTIANFKRSSYQV